MNYKTIGDIGQNCVIGELSKFGLGIAVLLSDNYPFDLIIIAGEKTFKAQVKTSTAFSEGSTIWSFTTNNWHSGERYKYSKKDCDVIICYDLVNHKTFIIDDFENRKSISIRYVKPKNGQRLINWFENYEISAKRIKKVFGFDVPNIENYYSFKGKDTMAKLICKKCGKEFLSSYKKAKYCSSLCKGLVARKVKRPNKDKLIELIKDNPMTTIGKMYNVSDNAIRKWATNYGINIKDIKNEILITGE